jgi:amino acid transporter
MSASNDHQHGPVIAIAMGLLTFCAGIHIFSRRGGIFLTNIFATIKILMVLSLAILGFVHAGGKHLQSKPNSINELPVENASSNITTAMINSAKDNNFNPHTSFSTQRHDLGSYVDSFLFALFAYTGFEQPFYVLSEVNRPRRVFPIYTVLGMALATFLYVFINISYFCVVPKEAYTTTPANTIDMASVFLHYLFDSTRGPHVARRVMAGLISVSIFGNVLVMTFTAARVKQEIAKEGILPFSLFFATGHTTPWAWFKSRMWPEQAPAGATLADRLKIEDHLEKSPVAALMLHWFSSILLVAVTSMLSPVTAYSFLASLYSYVNCILIGALVSGGLLYLKLDSWFRGKKGRDWAHKVNYTPWLNPLHVFVYFSATAFFLVATFVPPTKGSPYVKAIQGYPWWVLPTIGISSLLWGVVWWSGLKGIQWRRRVKLTVGRLPYIEKDRDGNYVQKAELVEHQWLTDVSSDSKSDRSEEVYQMT